MKAVAANNNSPGNTYATDGRCHNVEPGTFNHECGRPATYIGVAYGGRRSGFCDECRAHGYEAQGLVFYRIEPTAQGPQLVIPGAERSAHQAAASRDAAGQGRLHARKPQQEPGGLFAERIPTQPGLFDD